MDTTIKITTTTLIAFFVLLFLYAIIQPHNVERYYIASLDNTMLIRADIDWLPDNKGISLNGVSYEEAIEYVERLNKTLK